MVQRTKKTCSVDGCDGIAKTRSWCEMHYARWKRHGDPEKRFQPPTPEEWFLSRTKRVGDCIIWVGYTNPKGYGRINFSGRRVYAHRYAWELVNGSIPDGMTIDHKDHCSTSCVNVDHLRLATTAQNNSHRSGAGKDSKSGIRNVYPHKGKWRVRVWKNGKCHNFGIYDDIDEAAEGAQAAREELFGAY